MATERTQRARRLRGHLTDAEQMLWYKLRHRQLLGCKFRRQMPIGVYIVDFACIERRLVIEVDGGQHAGRAAYDGAREAFLYRKGYQVLRFWNHEVMQEVDVVLAVIHAALAKGMSPS